MVMRSLFSAMLFGWFLSAWVPVPGVIRTTASTTVTAFGNGFKAIATAINPPPAAEGEKTASSGGGTGASK